MKIVDLNVLLYAVNRDAPHHTRIRASWEELARGEETIGFSWSVLVGFLRLSSNPAVFPRPLDTGIALKKIDTWLALPAARLLTEKPEHWEVLRGLLAATGTAGSLTTDAHLAALAISHGAVLVSCDTDFARFPGLRWENPLA